MDKFTLFITGEKCVCCEESQDKCECTDEEIERATALIE